jgi:hypothetical protein
MIVIRYLIDQYPFFEHLRASWYFDPQSCMSFSPWSQCPMDDQMFISLSSSIYGSHGILIHSLAGPFQLGPGVHFPFCTFVFDFRDAVY